MEQVIAASLKVDGKNANQTVKEFKEQLALANTEVGEMTKKFGVNSEEVKKAKKKVEDLNGTLKDTSDASDKGAKGIGKVGTALKALGIITILVAAFEYFKEVLGRNQTVANGFTTVMKTLDIVFSDLVNFIINNAGTVVKIFKDIFENPTKYISKLGDAIKDNIIERVNSTIKVFGYLGDVIAKVFQGDFKGAMESGKKAGVEFVDVMTGVNDSANRIGKTITNAANAIGEYASNSYDAAKAQVELDNQAKIAAARLEGLVELYDRQAEVQRQLRDDESRSFTERIAANEELGRVLEKQEKAQLALAGVEIQKAKNELSRNKDNIDLQVAFQAALNKQAAISAAVTGLRSEQLVNQISLQKELLALQNAEVESENRLKFERLRANAELISDELKKQETIKAVSEQEAKEELKRLQDNLDATKEGTQLRTDALIAFNEKKQLLEIEADQREKAIADIKQKRDLDLQSARMSNDLLDIENKKAIAEVEILDQSKKTETLLALLQFETDAKAAQLTAQYDESIRIAELQGLSTAEITRKYNAEVLANETATTAAKKQLYEADAQAKLASFSLIANIAGDLSDIIGRETAAGKALAISQATIETYTSAQSAYAQAIKLPGGVFLAPISAAAAVVSGLANVRKIAAVKVPGSGSGGGIPNASAPAPLRPQQSTTQLPQDQINQIGNAAAGGVNRSFIIESDVTNNQEKIARLNRAARLGA